jgi:hypothetical protein
LYLSSDIALLSFSSISNLRLFSSSNSFESITGSAGLRFSSGSGFNASTNSLGFALSKLSNTLFSSKGLPTFGNSCGSLIILLISVAGEIGFLGDLIKGLFARSDNLSSITRFNLSADLGFDLFLFLLILIIIIIRLSRF